MWCSEKHKREKCDSSISIFLPPDYIFEKRTFPFNKDIERVTAHQYPLRSNTWAVRITSEAEEPARVRRVVA